MNTTKGTVIIGGTKSDAHVVSIHLVALLLRENGYEVVNRSCMNETEALLDISNIFDDPLAIIIVNQNGQAIDDLKTLSESKENNGVQAPIILGGHYWVGCHDRAKFDQILIAEGIDYCLTEIDDLLPLLEILESKRKLYAGKDYSDAA